MAEQHNSLARDLPPAQTRLASYAGRLVQRCSLCGKNPRRELLMPDTDKLPDDSCLDLVE